MIPINKGLAVIIFCSLIGAGSYAQQFRYVASLDNIPQAGFYSIRVSPELSALIQTDFADIRVADQDKHWIPHILWHGRSTINAQQFTLLPIIENNITDSGKNLLVIENTKAGGIGNLILFLKNSAVNRNAVLSGSYDRCNWYIIDDKIAINRSYETIQDEYLQDLRFPLSKYPFLKIVINNLHNDPLLITRAGWYHEPKQILPEYLRNPLPGFTQVDSNNRTYIRVTQKEAYHFDRLSLTVSGSKFYNRELQVCLPAFGKDHLPKPGKVIGSYNLRAELPAAFELPRTKTALCYIIINNADNPPLKVDTVLTEQHPVSLITYLDKGTQYQLLLGDSTARGADYDLQSFRDSIRNIHPLAYSNLHTITPAGMPGKPAGEKWIWLSIIVAGIILTYLTYRMTEDISRSKK
jgi:hypothetical protein